MARLPKSIPTLSPHRAPLLAHGKITSEPFLFFNLDWRSAPEKAKNRRYQHNANTAFANAAVPLVHDVSTLPHISLHLTDYLPPVLWIVPPYARLKLRAKQLLLSDWSTTPAPPYHPYPPSTPPHPFIGLGKFVAGTINQMRFRTTYLAAHPSWDSPDADTSCPLCSQAPQTFEHAILSCPSSLRQTSRLHKVVSDLAPVVLIWTDQQLLIAHSEFIRTSATGFPPGIPLLAPSLHTPPPNPLFQSTALSAPGPRDYLAVYTFLNFFSYGCSMTLIGRIGGMGYVCFLLLFVMFDFPFCFGLIVKDACHFLYCRNNKHIT